MPPQRQHEENTATVSERSAVEPIAHPNQYPAPAARIVSLESDHPRSLSGPHAIDPTLQALVPSYGFLVLCFLCASYLFYMLLFQTRQLQALYRNTVVYIVFFVTKRKNFKWMRTVIRTVRQKLKNKRRRQRAYNQTGKPSSLPREGVGAPEVGGEELLPGRDFNSVDDANFEEVSGKAQRRRCWVGAVLLISQSVSFTPMWLM